MFRKLSAVAVAAVIAASMTGCVYVDETESLPVDGEVRDLKITPFTTTLEDGRELDCIYVTSGKSSASRTGAPTCDWENASTP